MPPRHQLKHWTQRLHLLRVAAWTYELCRLITRPHTHGALVAIWWGEQLLLVKTSYRWGYGLPGGGVRRKESAAQAAVRELEEELGLSLHESWLKRPWKHTENNAGGSNTVTIFSLRWPPTSNQPDQQPVLIPDQIEIIETVWMDQEQALQQKLPDHLRRYLLERD